MLKKYYYFIASLVIVSNLYTSTIFGYGNSYQNYGFSQYTQLSNNSISFVCQQQCLLALGQKNNYNLIKIDGIQGQGQVIVGIPIVAGQIFPLQQITISQQSAFYTIPFFIPKELKHIPDSTPILLIFLGNIRGENTKIWLDTMTLTQQLYQGRKSFWTTDTFKPYTINLLYGPQRNGTSVIYIFSILFSISIAVRYIYNKKTMYRNIVITALILRIILDIRMGYETIKYYIDDYKQFISRDYPHKVYRDRGYFYSFVDRIHNTLPSSRKIIGVYTNPSRPFAGTLRYMLYPHTVIENYTGQQADALIYYNVTPPENISGYVKREFVPGAILFVK